MQPITPQNRLTHQRLRVRIPKQYHQEPILSHLVSRFQVTVNITAAILGANANGDGWFDLELRGTETQIQDATNYLNELGLELWKDSDRDGW